MPLATSVDETLIGSTSVHDFVIERAPYRERRGDGDAAVQWRPAVRDSVGVNSDRVASARAGTRRRPSPCLRL